MSRYPSTPWYETDLARVVLASAFLAVAIPVCIWFANWNDRRRAAIQAEEWKRQGLFTVPSEGGGK